MDFIYSVQNATETTTHLFIVKFTQDYNLIYKHQLFVKRS